MDYRKFLGKKTTMVLPYLGGLSVHAPDRRLRVQERVAVGWWAFEIEGRKATATEPSDPPELDRLPAVRGHLVDDWLFTGGETATRIHIMPEEQPEALCPAVGRRWAGGDVVFDSIGFDDEPEMAARGALLEDGSIAGLKGAVPSLRAAFGYARLARKARDRGLNVSVRESLGRVHAIADDTLSADALLDEIEARVFEVNPQSTHREHANRPTWTIPGPEQTEERAASVLEGAGAQLLHGRYLGDREFEVTFRYMDQQFIAVVDWETLHVFDSGICLSGHDEDLGLDSLPSVIAEAVEGGLLHITRW